MGDFAAAGRMAGMDRVLQVEGGDQLGDVGRIGVHVVAAVGLVGPSMATAVVSDHAKSFCQEKHHLVVPVIGTQGPAMMEHDRLGVSATPVLVEDAGTVFGGDECHGT